MSVVRDRCLWSRWWEGSWLQASSLLGLESRLDRSPLWWWENQNDVVVTWLLVDKWIKYYQLESLEANVQTASFRVNSTTNTVMITIFKFRNEGGVNNKTLKLQSSFGYSNITLINRIGCPTVYDTIEDVVKLFFKKMVDLYETLRPSKLQLLRRPELIGCERSSLSIGWSFVILWPSNRKTLVYKQMDSYKIPNEE